MISSITTRFELNSRRMCLVEQVYTPRVPTLCDVAPLREPKQGGTIPRNLEIHARLARASTYSGGGLYWRASGRITGHFLIDARRAH